eukprot:9217738-Karenia_brevis.AAC.1
MHSLSRWIHDQATRSWAANHLVGISRYLSRRIPPCGLHALMLLWMNAWPTARRFQEKGSQCLLHHSCEHAHNEDSIEHYGHCRQQWNDVFAIWRKPIGKSTFASLALIDIPVGDDVLLMSAH